MQAVRKALIAAASVGAIMAVVGVSPAVAGPLVNFTWNPNGTAPPVSTNASSQFTANDLTIADYANVIITQTGASTASATESALLNITGANTSGSTVVTPGLGGGVGPYQLYFSVTATATATGSGGVYSGYFTSITYSLIGSTGAACCFCAVLGPGAREQLRGSTEVLATGTLVPGQLLGPALGATNYVGTAPEPSAGAIVNIALGPNAGSFFVTPPGSALSGFEFITDFTNNADNVTIASLTATGEDIVINGGGGNINMLAVPVPEPLTISLFGAGLVGAGALRRRRSKKA